MLPPVVLLLAGGFATRLWPLTEKRAKPLLPLAGKPLIQHIIDALPTGMRIILSTNQVFEKAFLDLVGNDPDRKIDVFVEDSQQDRGKLGALAAVSLAIEHFSITSPLLLIAGDNYFGFRMEDFLRAYSGKTLLASFDTRSLQRARQFGVLEVKGRRLVSFAEKPLDPASTLISTGCYVFSPSDLHQIRRAAGISADHLGGVFEYLLKQGSEIEVFSFEEPWIDIGSFESYLEGHRLLLPGQRISSTATVKESRLGEAVEIGDHCTLEGCELENVMIFRGSKIRNSRLRGCIIDECCDIEEVDLDHKMIRSGTVLKAR